MQIRIEGSLNILSCDTNSRISLGNMQVILLEGGFHLFYIYRRRTIIRLSCFEDIGQIILIHYVSHIPLNTQSLVTELVSIGTYSSKVRLMPNRNDILTARVKDCE